MSLPVTNGALLRCPYGSTMASLSVRRVRPVASVWDAVPFENIPPFGTCGCPRNPQVAQAASIGQVGARVPCIPAVDQPWLAGSSRGRVDGVPGLAHDSTARCRWGGVISLVTLGSRTSRGSDHG
jgi:hypothetical protein